MKLIERDKLEFCTQKKNLGMTIYEKQIATIVAECCKSFINETGGILMGYYTNNQSCAEITDISKRPIDSACAKNWFYRGIVGLQALLNHYWHQETKKYYLVFPHNGTTNRLQLNNPL